MDTGARTDSPGLVVARGILRYSGHALREQLTRRRATRLMDVPVRTRSKFQPDSISLGILERASNAILDLDTLGAVNSSKPA